jgi:cytochrome c oxidase cbb3-type subunit 3
MEPNSSHRTRIAFGVIALGLALVVSACKPQGANSPGSARTLPPEGELAAVPLGDIAGAAKLRAVDEVANPLDGNASAIADGHRLFIAMNCAGCHGYHAKGGMGPNLTDAYWRYGGTPSGIYNSIYEGRPQGMPAWGRALPAQDIWKIVAYLQTLGGAVAANEYHAGLQGDHDLTSTAAEAKSLLGVFDNPSGTTASMGGQESAPSTPAPPPQHP